MNKKKMIVISIVGVVLLIGVSFASWIITLTQSNNNVIGSKCFNLTLSETNPINLTGAYPITDDEGALLTPFDFTITNTCNSYASYQVNLEILNTTDLAASEVKMMLDNDTPVVLSTKTSTTTTLSNATSAYIIKTGFLDPNESVTYHLRLWIKEESTMEASANKTFSSKITIAAGYKDNVSSMERCEAQYGSGASICNIIGQADPNNDKCLKVDENGMILKPLQSSLSDSVTPIVCTMEDEYGTSYYLMGNHQDNNVKFANMCWKLMRVTGTGGYKLLYNGDVDANGKCTTTSGTHTGFTGQTLYLSGNKVYGSSYTKEGSTYTLTDISTLNWPNDSSNIVGKYTCNSTGSTCTTLYLVIGDYNSNYYGYALKLDQSTNYAQIGGAHFNYANTYANYTDSPSPALVGYMYNESYPYKSKEMSNSGAVILSETKENTSNYYYGDTITYSNGYYYLTNHDGSNLTRLSWADNYTNLPGLYTCKKNSNATNHTCLTAYKVLDTTTKTNYMIAENLTGGRLAIGTIKLSSDYINNGDGTFSLKSPIVEISAMDWYNTSNAYTYIYRGYYYCGDYNQTTCTDLRIIIQEGMTDLGKNYDLSHNYYYGESFTYNNGTYTLNNTVQFWDFTDSTNRSSINTHHYTCFRSEDNTCNELYYVFYNYAGEDLYYILLNGNETGPEALEKMLSSDLSTAKNSMAKNIIDWWYEQNIKDSVYESYLEDTIFCNDRTLYRVYGWGETDVLIHGKVSSIDFNASPSGYRYFLKCPNQKDAFTVSDGIHGNEKLTYPIGLASKTEFILVGNKTALKTGSGYWSMSPSSVYAQSNQADVEVIDANGAVNGSASPPLGIRPSISLKPGTNFIVGGDGTASNPYEVDMNN